MWHCLSTLVTLALALRASAQDVHISQVFGGGGNTGAPYNADFVELYNAGTSTASIGGWTLTYAAATGSFGGSQFTLPPGTLIPPGGYLLIQMSAVGTTGAALAPDLVASPAIAMAADNANIALLTAAQGGTSNTCASLAATLVDKLAYGTGNCPEGSAVGALSSTTAAIRRANGATDTNSNSSDFFVGTPFPRNLAMRQAAIAETGSSPTADGWTVATSGTTSSGVANSDVGNPSWTLGATTSSTASATRSVTASAGMRAGIDLDHGTVPSGATVGVEFLSGTTTVMTFRLVGGASNYTLIDSSGTVTTTLAATTSGVRLALAVGASGAYTLTANTYSRSGTLAGSGTAISAVRVFNNGAGNTASTVLSFNHPAVSISTASLTSTVNASTTSIPDNNTSGRTISIPFTSAQIPSGLAVRDVRVTLNTLTHGNAGDIVGAVTAPGGGTATFLSLLGPGETSNFGGNYAFADSFTANLLTAATGVGGNTTIPVGNYLPSSTSDGARSALTSPLAASGNGAGTWTVRVSDQASSNTGTVASATLELRLGFDTDIDGVADDFDGCPTNGSLTAPATYYVDADGDGFGGTTTTTSCSNTPPAGASSVNTDCDDTNNARYPGATEICDGIDQDCDGAADDGFADTDGDGIGDCVDAYVTYTMTGASIPDATNATPPVVGVLERTFSVTAAQIPNGITDVRVRLNALSHTWIGDLTVQLIAPNGTTASIFTRPGFTGGTSAGDSSDFNGNYLFDDPATQSLWTAATTAAATAAIPAGSYFPSAATNGARVALTSAFSSVPTSGTWTVRITDAINQDVGSVGTIIVEFDPAPIVDTDGDGTPDSSDGCPNDPNKIAAGTCGCGIADTDSDGDGTPNCNDGCPNDPNKIAAGTCGCGVAETDSDNDGTPNCIDGCPNDPNKTAPGLCGCGTADTDTDGDGTPNCTDGCPNDPAKIAPGLCGCGTADTDTDGDGTPNCTDGCPNDPNKIAAGACGCGVADTDTDSDGTPDCNDGCPNDPAKIAPGLCGCGTADTDTDGDGTPNCTDGCPNDPSKIAAGACGCGVAETDSDNDGTPNCNDGCPNDPNKTAAGACGCGVAETDSDNDGTPNCNDGCPNDPNKIAAGACGCGVAETDSDNDGTPNCIDGCPNDPNKTAPGNCGCGFAESNGDSDNDGTPDCSDGCPNDPNKTAPGVCGCGVVENAADPDGDGTPNCADGCPNDPNKTAPGACGCGVAETDSDGDGTPNCNDGCPNDPNKTAPGACGCGVAETDTDGDGTPNCNDGCPNDPNKIAAGTCGCGIADTDTDGDGTPNCNDGCPNDPNKIAAGTCGCGIADTDTDGDGTPNCNDGCPNDPNKTVAGSCGCGSAETDSDGDGTPDCVDGCPNDANKVAAGVCGCGIAETDTDNDGTPNCNDGCPNDPNKTAPGLCGCGVADTDNDNDGTPNCNDGCPNDPNKVAAGVCGCGVADTDTDNDGTPNCNDGCPNDPAKTAPGLCGCGVADTDTDNDGTPNCNDGCPNDPAKIAPGVCGCGVADSDSDGDGTLNCNDGCPNDPAKIAPGVCGCGVADTDSDGDGTPNCNDTTFSYSLTGGSIPDASATGLVKTFTVSAGQLPNGFSNIRVTLTGLTHTWAGDVTATLAAPDGTAIPLFARINATAISTNGEDSDFGGTYVFDDAFNTSIWTAAGTVAAAVAIPAGDYYPSAATTGARVGLTNGLKGRGMTGTWTLRITDTVSLDTGSLGSAKIDFTPAASGDADGDGTPNGLDACPNDPLKTLPGGCGCGVADTDTDGDGTLDCNDSSYTVSLTGGSVPDNSTTGLVKTFTIANGTFPYGITAVKVTLTGLTHGNCGDLTATLTGPSGASATIFGRVGATSATGAGDTSNYGGDYVFFDAATASLWTAAGSVGGNGTVATGDYYPSVALTGARGNLTSPFAGTNLSGTWTLRIADTISSNSGTLGSAKVDFTPAAPVDSDGDGVPDGSDGCPNDPNKTASGACGCGVAETDSDGDGTPNCNDACPNDPTKIAVGACGCGVAETDSDNDGTPNCIDGCPNDPNKTASGACGCGSPDTDVNGNGTPDCSETTPTVSLAVVGGGAVFGAGDTVTVRVAYSNPARVITQARLSLLFNTSALLAVDVRTPEGGAFSQTTTESIDQGAGTIRSVVTAPGGAGSSGATVVDIDFVVLPGASACSNAGLVTFGSIAGASTELISAAGETVSLSTAPLPAIRADGVPPALAGVPSNATLSVDAGSIVGAAIAEPVVTAIDGCDGARSVALTITYPGGGTASAWPFDGIFPIGVTTLAYASTDVASNTTTATRTITVLDQQLVDLTITLGGDFAGASTRLMRIESGGVTQTTQVAMTGTSGVATGIAIPVSATPPCIRLKDVGHSVSRVGTAIDSGARWSLSLTLPQGDSNDDDVVDILDFAIFVANRGAASTAAGLSNFNADLIVNNADLAFIGLNYFAQGETCGGFGPPQAPRERVRVIDLVRAGMRDLAAADLDRDGWVSQSDIAAYLSGSASPPPTPRPIRRPLPNGSETPVERDW